MVLLRTYEINEDIFYKILEDYEARVKIVKHLNDYMYGYKERKTIMYNGNDQLICKEAILNSYCRNILGCTEWKQVRLIKTQNAKMDVQESINGTHAWNYIRIIMKPYYSDVEFKACLNAHTAPFEDYLKQYHYNWPIVSQNVQKLTNTYEFDINGAHLDALCEIFPKAKARLQRLYHDRLTNPVLKKYPNFFVGMLVKKGYRTTYNWIVQRTTKLLYGAIDKIGGMLIYANTDGFVVKDPKKLMINSQSLGQFKLEYAGDTYIYTDKNYILYQFGNTLKGSCLNEVRDRIDLSKGKVVHYDLRVNHDLNTKVAKNIIEETVEVWE